MYTKDKIAIFLYFFLIIIKMYVYSKSLNGNADFVYFLPWFLSQTNLNFKRVGSTHSFYMYMRYVHRFYSDSFSKEPFIKKWR